MMTILIVVAVLVLIASTTMPSSRFAWCSSTRAALSSGWARSQDPPRGPGPALLNLAADRIDQIAGKVARR